MKYTIEVSGRFACDVIASGSDEQEAIEKAKDLICSTGFLDFEGDVFVSEDSISAHAREYRKEDDWEAGSCWDEDEESGDDK